MFSYINVSPILFFLLRRNAPLTQLRDYYVRAVFVHKFIYFVVLTEDLSVRKIFFRKLKSIMS